VIGHAVREGQVGPGFSWADLFSERLHRLTQMVKVVLEMVVNKAGDKEIGMVVAGLHTQGDRHAGFLTGGA